MKQLAKKRLTLAIATALGSGCLAFGPIAAQADDNIAQDRYGDGYYSVPPIGGAATNTGDVATAYYIAQPEGGWNTLFNVTNTSTSALAVKVRVKEYKNSRDALDFWILMSPKDVWSGWLSQDADGVYIHTNDKTCTSPIEIVNNGEYKLVTDAFYGVGPDTADDGGNNDAAGNPSEEEAQDRLKMGHVEFIVAGECRDGRDCMLPGAAKGFGAPDGIGWMTEHEDGVPHDCAAADEYFLARDQWNQVSVPGNGDPKAADREFDGYDRVRSGAPLKVNVAYIRSGVGTGAATQAMHLDNVTVGENLVTAQNYPYFLEPTIATAPRGIWDVRGLLDLEQRFTWTDTFQEWSVNAVNGVQTSIMVNFPTKGYHVDQYCNEPFASNNRWRWNGRDALGCATPEDYAVYNGIAIGTDYSPITYKTGDFDGVRLPKYPATLAPFPMRWADGESPVQIGITAYDREEYTKKVTVISPIRNLDYLPWEVALIAFDENGGAFGVTAGELIVDAVAQLNATNGWLNIAFVGATDTKVYDTSEYCGYGYGIPSLGVAGSSASKYSYTCQGRDFHGQSFWGLPMHGIMIKTRSQGQPGVAYGQGTENGYDWEVYRHYNSD